MKWENPPEQFVHPLTGCVVKGKIWPCFSSTWPFLRSPSEFWPCRSCSMVRAAQLWQLRVNAGMFGREPRAYRGRIQTCDNDTCAAAFWIMVSSWLLGPIVRRFSVPFLTLLFGPMGRFRADSIARLPIRSYHKYVQLTLLRIKSSELWVIIIDQPPCLPGGSSSRKVSSPYSVTT
jgi:hypothetical protein